MSNFFVLLGSGVVLFLSLTSQVKATGSVALQWNQNPEPDIAAYRVHYGSSSGNYTQQIDVGNTTATTVSNLANGGTYFFVVTAYNTAMLESLPSNEVSATVGVNPTPTPTATATATPTATVAQTPTPTPTATRPHSLHRPLQLTPRRRRNSSRLHQQLPLRLRQRRPLLPHPQLHPRQHLPQHLPSHLALWGTFRHAFVSKAVITF